MVDKYTPMSGLVPYNDFIIYIVAVEVELLHMAIYVSSWYKSAVLWVSRVYGLYPSCGIMEFP